MSADLEVGVLGPFLAHVLLKFVSGVELDAGV
jgi:hypothetical protein